MDVDALEASELYSEELGIDLAATHDDQLFRWFLASIRYGARISETIARNAYRTFEAHDFLAPEAILDAGFDVLVDPIMREGGYARYGNRRSRQFLRDGEALLADSEGSLNRLHDEAADADDLEARLDVFYGVGPVTTNIFLWKPRPFWERADPNPLPIVEETAEALGLGRYDRKSLAFAHVHAGLIRRRHG